MKILFFAQVRTAAGCETCDLSISGPVAPDELWRRLIKRHPALESHRAFTRLARNHEFIGSDDLLYDEDEVALIPPVSGG